MEWLYSLLPAESSYYNFTLHLSILSCQELQADQSESFGFKDSTENTVETLLEEQAEVGLLDSIFNFFMVSETQDSQTIPTPDLLKVESEHTPSYLQNHCQLFFHLDSNQSILFVYLILVGAFLITFTLMVLGCVTSKLYKSKYGAIKNVPVDLGDETSESVRLNNANKIDEDESRESNNSEAANKNKLVQPLVIAIPKVNTQQFTNIEHHPSLDNIFEETVDIFVKELSHSLELGLHFPSERGDFGASSASSSSSNDPSLLASPHLVRRGLHYNRHAAHSPPMFNSSERKFSEMTSKYWIYFQNFRREMSWVYPDINFAHINFEQLSQANSRLASIIQFLHQRCSIRPKQWNAVTFIVDYTLFLLEHELKELSHMSGGLLKFTGFEGTGSAANGTLVGTADRFDVLLGVSISRCSEITVLHNKFYEEIPPGHIIIGVKDWGNSKQTIKFCRKACIHGVSGLYLIPQQLEDLIEELVKKAIIKLHREHKNKTDKLPFKFQMSPNKKFVISFDTKILQELGIGISEINVKLIPAIKIFVPQFGILPSVYAVSLLRSGLKVSEDLNLSSSNFLSRIVREQNPSDLLWEICTDKLQTIIIKNIENSFLLSGVRSYRRECLMVLKALFSKGSGNNLLNKGEIDAVILDTVVSFLLQESSSSEWALDNVSDRISDAIHFLKSAYQNILLPRLLIHNPHLFKGMSNLETMSCLLSGKQQNMLANVTNEAAMKVLDHINQRLQESGLSRCVKPEFSSHMWEYEFFLFG